MTADLHSTPLARILLVDDTPANLYLLSTILVKQGYEVRQATSGKMALESVRTMLPDLILLDIMMPDMSGYEVCRHLKADDLTYDIPVVFLSALDDSKNKVLAFDVGGADYITKPVQIPEVLVRVSTQLTMRQQQKQLQAQNAKLQQEIHDRLQAQTSLQALNQELETRVHTRTAELESTNSQLMQLQNELHRALKREKELNQLKDEFLNNVSHELRTPLNGLIGFLRLVLDGFCETRQEEMDMLRQVDASAMCLLEKINDMLDLASLKRGDVYLETYPVDLYSCLDAAIATQIPQMEDKGLQVDRPKRKLPIIVQAHPEKLQHVFRHVLNNAVKFSEEGTISISVQVKPSESDNAPQALIVIRDSGIGIDPDRQNRLFQPFGWGDGSKTRPRDGNGLGLAIAQNLLELMGGRISLWSAGKNQGTTVTISIPISSSSSSSLPRLDEGLQ
ncbi:MAG TPA: response regulator [Oscillatoriales cyanobacterium M59_W2019_021]|nr:MAG: hybrid sensor histidine kinase/response regulator [Cyanobacteria bacterium J055]HIK32051.1 response regulator [Oscillatoriales cyanobacterium M4454_W2019_049]HIK49695.1 response regulator [Oscillatoriales cyanobacterium M59_W2019_021]